MLFSYLSWRKASRFVVIFKNESFLRWPIRAKHYSIFSWNTTKFRDTQSFVEQFRDTQFYPYGILVAHYTWLSVANQYFVYPYRTLVNHYVDQNPSRTLNRHNKVYNHYMHRLYKYKTIRYITIIIYKVIIKTIMYITIMCIDDNTRDSLWPIKILFTRIELWSIITSTRIPHEPWIATIRYITITCIGYNTKQ